MQRKLYFYTNVEFTYNNPSNQDWERTKDTKEYELPINMTDDEVYAFGDLLVHLDMIHSYHFERKL